MQKVRRQTLFYSNKDTTIRNYYNILKESIIIFMYIYQSNVHFGNGVITFALPIHAARHGEA